MTPYPPLTSVPRHITLDDPSDAGPSTPTRAITSPKGTTILDPPRPSPILAATALAQPPTLAPQYAEDFTPLKLRRKRYHAPPAGPVHGDYTVGTSTEGYYTAEGDLYRGAVRNPIIPAQTIEEDAVTLGSSTSSSSSWSWASGISAGRRAKAVIDRVGEAFRRRGSGSSSDSSDDGRLRRTVTMRRSLTMSRTKSRSRRLSRTGTIDSVDGPRRPPQIRRREFTLLLPSDPIQGSEPSGSRADTPRPSISSKDASERVITTPSLPVVLDHLRSIRAVNQLSKARRPKFRQAATFVNPPVPRIPRGRSRLQVLRDQSMPELPRRPKSVSDIIGMSSSTTSLTGLSTPEPEKKGCWWLDVACPTWDDLRDLGEVLGLHPLTLEDILQQDPREKLDTFDSLGYYFLVVRALDEQYFKYTPGTLDADSLGKTVEDMQLEAQKEGLGPPQLGGSRRRRWMRPGKKEDEREKVEIIEDHPGKEGLEGVGVGAHNVYLIVFSDGIISFHFDDISKHTKRVLGRVLSNASAQAPGSDWIAHGILDSIVDQFLPLARYVDNEVDDLDSLTIDPTSDPKSFLPRLPPVIPRSSETLNDLDEKEYDEKTGIKISYPPARSYLPSLPHWSLRVPLPLIYLKLFFLPVVDAVPRAKPVDVRVVERVDILNRITDTRKLVTGLTRTLGQKHIVVSKLRKRAVEIGDGVEAYIGDVEDHILLLQNSLFHAEYILAGAQPAYMAYLSVASKIARGETDDGVLGLSVVAIGILLPMLVIGCCSMNVSLPHNGEYQGVLNNHIEPNGGIAPFNYFYGVCSAVVLLSCVVVILIRYWRWQARVKRAHMRGADLPPTWRGFWGWE
ncbi:hypothetical protein BD324DRAFT_630759 [Kockovaella imperatae]|uniref:Uncharacterized protein n=1 Tax=Kockovaella imperatae TaxID=4999 RepID=A0A1Y1UC45_9TREE|nr:hypothetical protein BD324DRAFT_630759 [Kockovaella imperatae]ORX35589.1 hypothetical protein BD324DRAFT_630759 [Kockovaella imperatae]